MPHKQYKYKNREISWLSFNERVLQEAVDESVPLVERLKFLGIYSSNMDEFFRIRFPVLLRYRNNEALYRFELAGFSTDELLQQVQEKIFANNRLFEICFQNLVKELEKNKIKLVNEQNISPMHKSYVVNYFDEHVRSHIIPIILDQHKKIPTLVDKSIYLATKLTLHNGQVLFGLIEVPRTLPRFVELPSKNDSNYVIFLDDIIRYNLSKIFKIFRFKTISAHTIKLTRDADLESDTNDIRKPIIKKMQELISKRKQGKPVRFVYDKNIPDDLLEYITHSLLYTKRDHLIEGGRYHNLRDLIAFPHFGNPKLIYPALKTLPHPQIDKDKNLMDIIQEKDLMIYYPYHSYNYTIDFLREAALDPNVTTIRIILYRIAQNSKVANALINAVRNGKKVIAIMELQARFDEEHNLYWSQKLVEEGVTVIPGIEGFKIHAKALLVTKKVNYQTSYYAYISTGNFNEVTARFYTDISIFTSNQKITREIKHVFDLLETPTTKPNLKHLLVSPFNTRDGFLRLIQKAKEKVEAKEHAAIDIKLNNLTDEVLINALYDAARAGVSIRIIARSNCCILPGLKGMGGNIQVRSIVDRFLEHARLIHFHFGNTTETFISSADWMMRNLDGRYELTLPIKDKTIQKQLIDIFEIQWKDNMKARIVDSDGKNQYHHDKKSPQRSQLGLLQYFRKG